MFIHSSLKKTKKNITPYLDITEILKNREYWKI